jgi:predicted N-acetyltransferase YhbS
VGFACHDATCLNFFGPTGVEPKAQQNGIGKALLFACLEDMKHQGFGYAIIGGVGPAEFYSKAVGAVAIEGSALTALTLIVRLIVRATGCVATDTALGQAWAEAGFYSDLAA